MGLSKVFLAMGIAVLLAVFIAYGLYTVYQPPQYDYYSQPSNNCQQTFNCDKPVNDCYETLRKSSPYSNLASKDYDSCRAQYQATLEYKACQDSLSKCNEEYHKQTPKYKYNRNSFFILIVLGIISIVAGVLLSGLEGIGSGIMGGGILTIFYSLISTWQYWYHLNRYLRVAVIGIVLILLIALGYWRVDKNKSNLNQ